MTSDLPRPLTTDHKLLVALAGRLDAQNALLAQILDRLPAKPAPAGGGKTVELREPAPQTPDETAAGGSDEPSPPARRTRKTTPKGRTPGRETP